MSDTGPTALLLALLDTCSEFFSELGWDGSSLTVRPPDDAAFARGCARVSGELSASPSGDDPTHTAVTRLLKACATLRGTFLDGHGTKAVVSEEPLERWKDACETAAKLAPGEWRRPWSKGPPIKHTIWMVGGINVLDESIPREVRDAAQTLEIRILGLGIPVPPSPMMTDNKPLTGRAREQMQELFERFLQRVRARFRLDPSTPARQVERVWSDEVFARFGSRPPVRPVPF